MAELNCELCQERAAELALGVLGGRERAETLAHLQDCDRCQGLVADLAATASRLFDQLLPEVEPPPGLDQRIMRAVIPGPAPASRTTSRERVPVAVAVLAMVLLMAGGLVFSVAPQGARRSSDAGGQVTQHSADMLAAPLLSGQQQIGTAYLFAHRPVWVVVSISRADDPSTATLNDTVSCDLVRKDGTRIPLGTFALNDGHADWAAGAAVDPATLGDARLSVQVGRVMSYASFAHPVPAQTSAPSRPAVSVGPGGPAAPAPDPSKDPKDPKQPKDPKAPKTSNQGSTAGDPLPSTEKLKLLAGPGHGHHASHHPSHQDVPRVSHLLRRTTVN